MLTISSPATYYLWRGARLGFEYELVRRFADSHGLDLWVTVAADHEELAAELTAGRGDLVAAGWVMTPDRVAAGLLFTRHYLGIGSGAVPSLRPDRAGRNRSAQRRNRILTRTDPYLFDARKHAVFGAH